MMAIFLATMNLTLEHARKTLLTSGIRSLTPISRRPDPTAPTSPANGKLDQEVTRDKEEDAMTKGTKNIDLNGSYWRSFTYLFVFLADIADVKI